MSVVESLKQMAKPSLVGFIGPLIGLIGIAVSILISPGFSWQDDPLSDLGSYFETDLGDYQLVSAISFNGGLILSGIFQFYFAFHFFKNLDDWPTKLAMTGFMVTCISLSLVGVFSKNFGFLHQISAVTYFLAIPITLAIAGMAWLRFSEIRWLAWNSLLFAVVNVVVIFQSSWGVAVREIINALIIIGWIWVIGFLYYKKKLTFITKQ
ncbi:MAG: DUF998 domain-containing protein [Candidatus Thorarchaeota archaeon]